MIREELQMASVIVRALNKAGTIGATLGYLRRQTVPVEIIVVDSGSIDGTVAIAKRHADKLIQISPSHFSYGGALNLGAEAALGNIHFALSAHGAPLKDTWVQDSIRHYLDERVVGTNGCDRKPNGHILQGIYSPTLEEALENFQWGYSNHASSWRARAWRENKFREDLPACEDKEWFWRMLELGWIFRFDSALTVSSAHRRRESILALWKRTYREGRGLAMLGQPPNPKFSTAINHWWSDFPYESSWPQAARRVSPLRLAEHIGFYMGSRRR